jgi:peptide/nickel transport system permease protein
LAEPARAIGVGAPPAAPGAWGPRLRRLRTFVLSDWRIFGPVLFLVALGLVAAFGSLIAPYGPDDIDAGLPLSGISAQHPLGVDAIGRDQLSRLIAGTGLTIGLSAAVALASVVIGTAIGLIVGYLGGRLDFIVGRVVDVFFAFPGILVALVLVTLLGPGIQTAAVAMVVIFTPETVRFMRAVVAAERNREYVVAARVAGASLGRVLFRHLLPNVRSQVLVIGSLVTAFAALTEAALSFLGVGAPPGAPTWGRMITEGRPYLTVQPGLALGPGAAVSLVILALNLLADGLRDQLDPTTRRVDDDRMPA